MRDPPKLHFAGAHADRGKAKELHEEGIAFAPLPVLPDEFN